MSGVDEHKIVRDLRAANAKYVDSAKGDVMAVMRVYKDLKSDSELYMFPDGKKRQAFKIYGTVPVQYKGAVYNIPISIYLWDSHPYYAPICNVVPTASMVIKESEHVNKQGRVFLPYLNEWRFPGYDLYGLIQMMVMIFQDRCPLFARSSGGSTSSSTTQPAATYTHPAMPTPYPTDNALPYPVQPGGANSTPYPTASTFPTPYPSMGSGYNPQPVRPAPPVPPPPTDAIRSSLISAVEEKLRNRLRDKLGTTYAERASMSQTQTELKAGQQRLRVAIETLEKQSKELDGLIDGYSSKKSELEKALAEVSSGEEPTIDEAIDASTPLERQLLDAYASDLACDDAYYVLGEALKNGALSSSDYLRYIRDISRKQFVHRATMRKCRITLGLAA
ncbi:hypothetical protein PMAYCL1PPCAC_18634 [Pristionchus mayeri]|uniref:Uncharacterized protein n=1 Tax=Pristionchus mayeri TaxID=1317129 RepID=A0AAN5CPY2_9BILA|nr:hypothetical protein PMAYCL1PPCAC_18634 [Pristionchus mayeri]